MMKYKILFVQKIKKKAEKRPLHVLKNQTDH